jgi:hypothetical protein
MAIKVQPFDASQIDAVVDFNRRLAAHGSSWRFPEHPLPSWLPREPGSPLYQEFLLASDGAAVRGAYVIQHRTIVLGGAEQRTPNWYLPISEGLVDASYATVAPSLLRDLLRRHPLNFGVGMNGIDSPLAHVAMRLGFEARLLPFFLRIEHGARFVREVRRLRQRRALALLLDAAAASGAAWLGAKLLTRALDRAPCLAPDLRVETVAEFGGWADDVWQRCRGHYSFIELRDAANLSRIYPRFRQRLERLRVLRGEAVIGWAVLQVARFTDNPNFGSLHVGRLTDCLATPEDAGAVVRAAVDALRAHGVELMLSNQSHPAWCAALRRCGFLPAPSNFAFVASPKLAAQLRAVDPEGRRMHLNRGDGDGPWGHDPRAF